MSEIIAEAIVEKRVLQQLIDTYTPFVDEAKLHFSADGVNVRAVDPGNVMMVMTELDAGAFESWDTPGSVTIGVNLNAIDDRLSVGSPDDLVHLAVDMETRMLTVEVGKYEQRIGMIDPEHIRHEPELPDIRDDLKNGVVIEAGELSDIHTATEMVSDHLEVQGNPKQETVTFYAKGDIDDVSIPLGNEDVIDAHVPDAAKSMFSLSYFGDMVKPIPSGGEVSINFGNEFPMIWEWEATDGFQQSTSFIAPRVGSDF